MKKMREPLSATTHLIGAILSFIALLVMLWKQVSAPSLDSTLLFSTTIFGISLILLYTTSSIYHALNVSDSMRLRLRKLDHAMIYVLIAGSYTPFCLNVLPRKLGLGIFILVWSLAILGIIIKLCWFNAPRLLSTGFYIGLGWLALFIIVPMTKALSPQGLFYLALGGALYTIGGVIYAMKKPNFKHWGFHEIFHLFVMGGSIVHFGLIYSLII